MLWPRPRHNVSAMLGRSWRFARIAGIPIGVSPWWLIVVALITYALGASYFPESVAGIAPAEAYALGLASALALFASILLHELGHAIVARRRGIQVTEIDLWLLGGVARMEGEAHTPQDELRFAIAGPAVTAVILAVLGTLDLLLAGSMSSTVEALLGYQLLINAVILVFNLMPAFPLDGGRVARSLLWRRSGDMQAATRTAAGLGRGFGYLLIGIGVLSLLAGAPEGLWLGVIGFFLVTAATAEAQGSEVRAVLSGVTAAELMSAPALAIPAGVSVEEAAGDYFARHRYTAFPVIDSRGSVIGLLTLDAVAALAPAQRSMHSVAELMDGDPALQVEPDTDVARLLERPAFARVGRAVVVSDGQPVGLISITDVQRTLRSARLQPTGTARV